jgi:hypothetical protein
MRTILFALVVATGCHHEPAPQAPQPADPVPTAASNDDVEHMPADPTLPSWAPAECAKYHEAVIKLSQCEAVSQDERNVAKTQYDTDDARWKAMHDQPPEALVYVRDDCKQQQQAVDTKNACLVQNHNASALR